MLKNGRYQKPEIHTAVVVSGDHVDDYVYYHIGVPGAIVVVLIAAALHYGVSWGALPAVATAMVLTSMFSPFADLGYSLKTLS